MVDCAQLLTVAVYQSNGHVISPENQTERLRIQLLDCRGQYDLVVCPELYLSGYFAEDQFHDLAESVDGPCMRSIREIAVEAQCGILYGFPEKAGRGLYNSCALVDSAGQLVAVHRKTVFPHEYERRYFGPGSGPTIVDWLGWKVGMLICYEAEFPENFRFCALRGCDLVIVPTALSNAWRVVAQRVIPARAFENNVFVAYANYCGNANDTNFLGESVIVDPFGDDIVRSGQDERLEVARLNRASVSQARERLRFFSDLGYLDGKRRT